MLDQASLNHIQERNAAKRWDKIHTQIQERWSSVPLFELQAAGGDAERLAEVVRRHTSQDGVSIDREVRQIVTSGQGVVGQARKAAADIGSALAETAARTRRAVDESAARSPGTTLSVALGAGMVIGSLLSCLLVQRPKPTSTWDRIRPW